jgi:N-acetylglucosaminyl-diphospho-decaprenol L-rhamnosyltransferase
MCIQDTFQGRSARVGADAIIVTFNSSDALSGQLACPAIRSAFDSIVVVDNGSTDGCATIAETAGVRALRRDKNGGLAVALNEGFRATDSEFIAILNPDVLLQDVRLVSQLLKEFDDPRVGLVAPRLRLPSGKDQDSARRVPSPLQLITRRLTDNENGAIRPNQPSNVPWVVLAFVIVRRAALEQIGGFDEDYFLYFEDVDVCVRLWKAGWKVRLDTTSVAHHAFQAASRGSIRDPAKRHHLRSAGTFFTKHPRAIWGRMPLLSERTFREAVPLK